jgi:bacillolysin/neutral peptidase B
MAHNGLQNFTMHSKDARYGGTVAAITSEVEASVGAGPEPYTPEALDPETVARRYLTQMIASPAVPALTAPESDVDGVEYRTIGTETVPLTGTRVVKFAQYLHRVPVYGALVTVELDADNSFLAINSALGEPTGVDPAAAVSPADALAVIRHDAGTGAPADPPKLYYYFDTVAEPYRWRLVYIAKDIPRRAEADAVAPELVDYVVDAHSGELVARLPRTQSVSWNPMDADEADALGAMRRLRVERDEGGNMRLCDPVRNVRTHDFQFRDVVVLGDALPGDFCVNPPPPWDVAAISAHANAAMVADFLVTVLRRNGLDNQGGPYVSSINCTFQNPNPTNREWRNAAWIGTQMIYGQRTVNGVMRSYALARDVVAHEITHGLTDKTARLEYARESGALNESYSDIFGTIISNAGEPDVDRWNWEMGEDLDATGIPIRDMSDPTRRGQPAHMDDFRRLAPGEQPSRFNDSGWVHHNSGIHNKAAYNLITAKHADGTPVFTPQESAGLFYLALTQYLSRTSGFSDSRRAVALAAQTLFRGDPPDVLAAKLAAVAAAFDAVGIT